MRKCHIAAEYISLFQLKVLTQNRYFNHVSGMTGRKQLQKINARLSGNSDTARDTRIITGLYLKCKSVR